MTKAPLHSKLGDCPPGGKAVWLSAWGARIRAAFWKGGTRGTVLIFTGRTEYIEKYGRVAAAFVERGFSVVTLDWRGQGLSDRMAADPMKGHVQRFSDYQADVDALLEAPEMAEMPQPHVLLCHSMGGCIGLRALVDERITPALTIMSGPMMEIELKPHLRLAVTAMAGIAARLGLSELLAPRPGNDQCYVQYTDFAENMLTHDEDYYDWMRIHLEQEPGFALGGPTLGWMRAAFAEMNALRAAAAPAGPILLFLGDREQIVGAKTIREFDARAPLCRLEVLENCKHETLMETPDVQAKVWATIDAALAEIVPAA